MCLANVTLSQVKLPRVAGASTSPNSIKSRREKLYSKLMALIANCSVKMPKGPILSICGMTLIGKYINIKYNNHESVLILNRFLSLSHSDGTEFSLFLFLHQALVSYLQ